MTAKTETGNRSILEFVSVNPAMSKRAEDYSESTKPLVVDHTKKESEKKIIKNYLNKPVMNTSQMILSSPTNKKLQPSPLRGVKNKMIKKKLESPIGKKVAEHLPPQKVKKVGKIQEKIKLFENLAQSEQVIKSYMSPMCQTAPRINQTKENLLVAEQPKVKIKKN